MVIISISMVKEIRYKVGDLFLLKEYIPIPDEDPFFAELMKPLHNTIGIIMSVRQYPNGLIVYTYFSLNDMVELQLPSGFVTELLNEV